MSDSLPPSVNPGQSGSSTWVSNELIREIGLDPALVVSFAQERDRAGESITRRELQEKFGMTYKQVRRFTDDLVESGHLIAGQPRAHEQPPDQTIEYSPAVRP